MAFSDETLKSENKLAENELAEVAGGGGQFFPTGCEYYVLKSGGSFGSNVCESCKFFYADSDPHYGGKEYCHH